jgi:RNA polymerase sigma-70 factor (ECF subfamily)
VELCWTIEMSLIDPPGAEGADARLVQASRTGDREAFSELVRLHQRRVFRLAGRFFRGREDVEDVAQETFLTAWRKLDTYRARAPFEHWLTRVCLNCCYARLRRKQPPSVPLEHDVPASGTDPDARLEVERLLRSLKPADRFILLLLDGAGWSVTEIAERLGWTQANVKVRAHRARKKLRRLLEQDS